MNEIVVHETPYGSVVTRYFNTPSGRNYKRILINKSGVETIRNKNIHSEFAKDIENAGFPVDELKSIIGSKDFFIPIHFQIELTDVCNLNCPYCYRDSKFMEGGTFIDYKELIEILKIYKKLGLKEIGITGGEPTLHPEFSRILRFILKNFPFVELITNGTNAEPILKAIKRNKYRYRLDLSISFNMWAKEVRMFLSEDHYLNNTLKKYVN